MARAANKKLREVVVLGGGVHPFGAYPDKTFVTMAGEAFAAALDDSGLKDTRDIDCIGYSHALEQSLGAGQLVAYEFGMNGIPIIGNVENACTSTSSVVWLAKKLIEAGVYDVVAAIGCEKMPSGPLEDPFASLPDRYLGLGLPVASYAMKGRRYMMDYGATIESFAQVSVKSHHWACFNPDAQFRKAVTLDRVMNSKMIADPLTLFMCSPTGEGAAAVILCAAEVAGKYTSKPLIRIAGCGMSSHRYSDGAKDGFADNTAHAAQIAYEEAGIGPDAVDLVEVHDGTAPGELIQIESLGVVPRGEGWKWTLDGNTDRLGKMPTNISGGLKACGHPLGATGARQLVEIVRHLRNEAGERQVPDARIGVASTAGFGGSACVTMLVRD